MDITPEIPIPYIDPALYTWQPHPTSRLYLRRALGLETKWARQEVKNRQLFLSGIITLKTPLKSISELYAAVTHTWVRLRFEFPEVVLKFGGDWVDGNAIMQCQIPRSDEEASDWVRRTLWLEGNITEADPILSAERQMRKHDVNDPFCLQLIPTTSRDADGDKIVRSAFSFRVDHQLADGMGVYILASNFFRILAEEVATKTSEKIDWEKAAKNIPKPWVQMMNEKQKTEGEDFENKVKKNADLVMESIKGEWGLIIRPGEEYTPKSVQKIFPVEQTKAILRSVKSEIGPAATVTHLGHAAMAMTLLSIKPAKDRPLTCDKFVCPLFMSGRRYLDPEQPKSKNYVPMCRAIGAIEFRNIDRYRLLGTESRDEVRRKLKMACEEAGRSYQVIRERESVLTESFAVAEYMGTARNAIKGKETMDPLFLSDGIVEQYISRSYADIRGNNTLTVDDVRFTANPDGPPIIIRMYTFRDVIRIGAEWNGAWYDDADVQRFLDSITDLMLSLT